MAKGRAKIFYRSVNDHFIGSFLVESLLKYWLGYVAQHSVGNCAEGSATESSLVAEGRTRLVIYFFVLPCSVMKSQLMTSLYWVIFSGIIVLDRFQ